MQVTLYTWGVSKAQRLFMVTSVLKPCWLPESIKLIGYRTEKSVSYEVQPIGNQECAKKELGSYKNFS
jgi:hypothetical protein